MTDSRPRGNAALGFGALALGILGLLLRYVFLSLGGGAATAITGGSIGLIVVSVRTLWSLYPAVPARVGLALIIPIAFAGSMALTWLRASGPVDLATTIWEL